MKRRDLMNKLAQVAQENGHALTQQEGGNHTKVIIGDWKQPIPRHREIDEKLARTILHRAERHFTKEEQ